MRFTVSPGVKIRKTPVKLLKVSSEVTASHTSVRCCQQFPVRVHPVLLDPKSAPPLPSITQSIDVQTIFGSTLTLKAEVLWILNTIAKHFGNRFGCKKVLNLVQMILKSLKFDLFKPAETL